MRTWRRTKRSFKRFWRTLTARDLAPADLTSVQGLDIVSQHRALRDLEAGRKPMLNRAPADPWRSGTGRWLPAAPRQAR